MENLVSLAEAMQQASSILQDDNDDSAQYTTFLDVVTIGNTGAGKSAVLNSIIGYTVMPTGENGATRAPIVVELERDQSGSKGLAVMTEGRARQSSANEIRLSLQSRLSRIASSRNSRPDEIRLRLRSSAAPPLTLIDLPGLASIDDEIVTEYGSHNDAVLLVVVPASSVRDITASQALKIAKELDPEFSRTVGVISKVDQSANDPKSLAAVQAVLSGQGPSVTADITWVALIGQSVSIAAAHSGSVGTDDSLETAWKAEAESLKSILTSSPSTRLGRTALVDVLSSQIRKRIKQRLPSLLSGLEGRQQEVEGELVRLGEQMVETEEGTRALALELCREFEDKYILHINSGDTGGWRVISSFEGALPNKFKNLPLNDLFDLNYLKKVVLEADGYQPYLISPEKGLRELVRRALELAKDPGRHCVDEVHHVLIDIVSAAASSTPGLGRYPPFKRELVVIASGALDEYRTQAKKMVTDLVDMERSYIPPQHFNRLAQRRIDRLKREEDIKTRSSKKAQDAEQAILTKAAGPPVNQTPPLKTMKGQSDKDKDSKDGAPSSLPGGDISGVYLMKKSANKSGWKKRWFVLNEKTNRLGYTKTPDERLFRGVINLEECVIDDADKEDDDAPATKSSKKERASDSNISLSFKITNKVPYKSVLKAHSSVVLKAESIAEKQEWMAKLRACAQGSQQQPGGKSSSVVKEPPSQPRGSIAPEPVQETSIRRPADPDEDLRFIGQEVRDYVEAVLNSLSANIPKAVVLCQVEKSKDAMLTKLYNSISKFSSAHIQELLQEDPEVKRRRERFQRQSKVLNKLTHQLSMHEARVSTASGYSETDGYASPKGSGEDWRVAFESASTAPPSAKSLSINGRIDRRFTASEENGDISSSRRSTPSRAAPAPPGSVYRG